VKEKHAGIFFKDFLRALLNLVDLSISLHRVHEVTCSKTIFNKQLSNRLNGCGIGALGKSLLLFWNINAQSCCSAVQTILCFQNVNMNYETIFHC
jgi:hypothetical protein